MFCFVSQSYLFHKAGQALNAIEKMRISGALSWLPARRESYLRVSLGILAKNKAAEAGQTCKREMTCRTATLRIAGLAKEKDCLGRSLARSEPFLI